MNFKRDTLLKKKPSQETERDVPVPHGLGLRPPTYSSVAWNARRAYDSSTEQDEHKGMVDRSSSRIGKVQPTFDVPTSRHELEEVLRHYVLFQIHEPKNSIFPDLREVRAYECGLVVRSRHFRDEWPKVVQQHAEHVRHIQQERRHGDLNLQQTDLHNALHVLSCSLEVFNFSCIQEVCESAMRECMEEWKAFQPKDTHKHVAELHQKKYALFGEVASSIRKACHWAVPTLDNVLKSLRSVVHTQSALSLVTKEITPNLSLESALRDAQKLNDSLSELLQQSVHMGMQARVEKVLTWLHSVHTLAVECNHISRDMFDALSFARREEPTFTPPTGKFVDVTRSYLNDNLSISFFRIVAEQANAYVLHFTEDVIPKLDAQRRDADFVYGEVLNLCISSQVETWNRRFHDVFSRIDGKLLEPIRESVDLLQLHARSEQAVRVIQAANRWISIVTAAILFHMHHIVHKETAVTRGWASKVGLDNT